MINFRVPATSANLGPGFDCLGLALNIWNKISIETANKVTYHANGEGAEKLNKGTKNLLTKAYTYVHEICGRDLKGFNIQVQNEIPMSSGLGSSAAAIIAGLFGANELLGHPLNENELLILATDMEGHPDNVAPALLGGLVVSVISDDEIITRRFDIPDWAIVVVNPAVEWPTRVARAVLPKSVSRADAVYNIGRAALVVDALRNQDLELLQKVMDDRLHQSYRLKHITGAMAAYKTAKQFGAAALSGAGPSIICFVPPEKAESAKTDIMFRFEEHGIKARGMTTSPSQLGAHRI